MIEILVTRGWAQGGRIRFTAASGPLRDIIKRFAEAQPDYRRRLLDDDGEPYGYLNIFVDDELVPRGQRHDAAVADGSTVAIVPPLVGG